ncbi:MAG: phosphocholine cytidylyltransferase family protein [Microthrixaceae bacterium]
MIGLVLAAGAGRRLGHLTEDLPKTLLPVRGQTSILEITLANIASVGIADVAIVTGFAEHRIRDLVPELQERTGLNLELVHNAKALEWNNAYSLWCARGLFAQDVLLCNGDTVHPSIVEERLLAAAGPSLRLGIEMRKVLGEEEMKVEFDASGCLVRINKGLEPGTADGEYMGVALIEAGIGAELTAALQVTYERDPDLYYEDGFQELVLRGIEIGTVDIGEVAWVEVDDPTDLARAREIACHY